MKAGSLSISQYKPLLWLYQCVRTATSNKRLNNRMKVKDNEHTVFVN